jgi:hypothetical protein
VKLARHRSTKYHESGDVSLSPCEVTIASVRANSQCKDSTLSAFGPPKHARIEGIDNARNS